MSGRYQRAPGTTAGPHTKSVHAGPAGPAVPPGTQAGSPPIFQSSVFLFDDLEMVDEVFDGRTKGYSYSRIGNPNCDQLAAAVAGLEAAEAGTAAASGMAAVHAALRACLTPERRQIVAADDIYGGTYTLFEEVLRPEGIAVDYVPSDQLDQIAARVGPGTAALYFETISNPTLRVADLPAIAGIAAGAGVPLVVDNTFASPYVCRPLEHGATLVVHSVTKFLAGHHDTTAGVVVGPAALVERSARYTTVTGGTLDPFCAWLALRGIRTMSLRMERSTASAAELASFLAVQPQVRAVHYPGLTSHPDAEVAQRVLGRSGGAMLSFELRDLIAAKRFVRSLRLIRFAPSLGGYDTTISHPVLTSHRGVPPAKLKAMGITEGLIRMSVGCEDLPDLRRELERALAGLDG